MARHLVWRRSRRSGRRPRRQCLLQQLGKWSPELYLHYDRVRPGWSSGRGSSGTPGGAAPPPRFRKLRLRVSRREGSSSPTLSTGGARPGSGVPTSPWTLGASWPTRLSSSKTDSSRRCSMAARRSHPPSWKSAPGPPRAQSERRSDDTRRLAQLSHPQPADRRNPLIRSRLPLHFAATHLC